MVSKLPFQFVEALRERLVFRENAPNLDEDPHDEEADFHRTPGVENAAAIMAPRSVRRRSATTSSDPPCHSSASTIRSSKSQPS